MWGWPQGVHGEPAGGRAVCTLPGASLNVRDAGHLGTVVRGLVSAHLLEVPPQWQAVRVRVRLES